MRVAIQVRMEQHAFVGHLAKRVQAEDLKAAGVRQDRPRPIHELVQAAQPLDPFMAGPQKKMIGIRRE